MIVALGALLVRSASANMVGWGPAFPARNFLGGYIPKSGICNSNPGFRHPNPGFGCPNPTPLRGLRVVEKPSGAQNRNSHMLSSNPKNLSFHQKPSIRHL